MESLDICFISEPSPAEYQFTAYHANSFPPLPFIIIFDSSSFQENTQAGTDHPLPLRLKMSNTWFYAKGICGRIKVLVCQPVA